MLGDGQTRCPESSGGDAVIRVGDRWVGLFNWDTRWGGDDDDW